MSYTYPTVYSTDTSISNTYIAYCVVCTTIQQLDKMTHNRVVPRSLRNSTNSCACSEVALWERWAADDGPCDPPSKRSSTMASLDDSARLLYVHSLTGTVLSANTRTQCRLRLWTQLSGESARMMRTNRDGTAPGRQVSRAGTYTHVQTALFIVRGIVFELLSSNNTYIYFSTLSMPHGRPVLPY